MSLCNGHSCRGKNSVLFSKHYTDYNFQTLFVTVVVIELYPLIPLRVTFSTFQDYTNFIQLQNFNVGHFHKRWTSDVQLENL